MAEKKPTEKKPEMKKAPVEKKPRAEKKLLLPIRRRKEARCFNWWCKRVVWRSSKLKFCSLESKDQDWLAINVVSLG
ncbi:hypothetical protein L1987_49055 [Smallanthus sonchifolius]|uniref:Uncharacterized protein n=1 Tax=Smallanthus sonchifolius TaxID=185202 RepID=A0ACB9FTG1_9ASTR|nr:hypothetical protein L1987_49055 [Smallanthus sonchifolius]